ncbi:MAG: CRISPR-associated endonuclease Cas1 [Deltaproteobacteria bacterium]|nr:MAG: CRISPR-associated endonuclease Cas1 [Deltaproteobacteria bacterium]
MCAKLFDQFIDEANLLSALQRVQGKNAPGGVDKNLVQDFIKNQDQNIRRLHRQLQEGSYIPQPVQEMAKPTFNRAGEFHKLGLPVVADKIVQTAILQVVAPLAEKLFLDTSYANRERKGRRKAINRVIHNLRSKKQHWIVHQDIDHFFDNLNHNRLLELFSRLVDGDSHLTELIALFCRTGIVTKKGRGKEVAVGIRQGQIISPFLANLYLHDLDLFAARHNWGYVRYVDDYVIQCQNRETAEDADKRVRLFIEEQLELSLNQNDAPVTHIDQGFVFLGIFFKGDCRRIARQKVEKIERELSWYLSPKSHFDMDAIFGKLQVMAEGWYHYYGFLGAGQQFAAIEKIVEKKLGQLIRQRISEGRWPKKAPDQLALPLPSALFKKSGDARKQLIALWKKAQPSPSDNTNQPADKQTQKRRKKYRRKQTPDGEIFVLTPGFFVGKQGGRIVVREKQRIISEMPISQLQGLTLADRSLAISTNVLSFCCRNDIACQLIDNLGNIRAVLSRPDSTNAELVLKQVSLKDDTRGLELARMFIIGKVKNQLAVLKAYGKYKKRNNNIFNQMFMEARGELEDLVKKIKALEINTSAQAFRNSLMGLEGIFALKYWQLINHILPAEIAFPGRKRRGATDTLNSMLNYGYGILYGQALNAVTRAGLNAMAGFLHAYQHGKPVLTFDLVEEFRAPVVDKVILSMIGRRIKCSVQKNGMLDNETRKKTAAAITARLSAEVSHYGQRQTLQEVIYHQAKAIRKHLYGRQKYRPYLSRW